MQFRYLDQAAAGNDSSPLGPRFTDQTPIMQEPVIGSIHQPIFRPHPVADLNHEVIQRNLLLKRRYGEVIGNVI